MAEGLMSGTRHFIISKKFLFIAIMVGLGMFIGTYTAEHLHAKKTEETLRLKNTNVKQANALLKDEKDGYKRTFSKLSEYVKDFNEGRMKTAEARTKYITDVHDQAMELIQALSDMENLLEDKEFQLWEKEGLLQYQEERLINSEDMELEMADYINALAKLMKEEKLQLPAGLEDKAYYGMEDSGMAQD